MATKANAHYVDCDINPDSRAWTCTTTASATSIAGFLAGGYLNGAYRCDTDYEIAQQMGSHFAVSVDHHATTGYFAVSARPGGADGEPALVYDSDGNDLGIAFDAPATGWAGGQLVMGVRFSNDGTHLFVYTIDPERLYKFKLSDGSMIWESKDGPGSELGGYAFNGYGMDIDSSDNLYIPAVRPSGLGDDWTLIKVSGTTGLYTTHWTDEHPVQGTLGIRGTRDIHVESELGWGFVSGGISYRQGYLFALDSNTVIGFNISSSSAYPAWAATYLNNHWYVYTTTYSGKNLWKIDSGANVIDSILVGGSPIDVWRTPDGYIGLHGNADPDLGQAWIRLYDEDLNLVMENDCKNASFPSASFATYWGSEGCVMLSTSQTGETVQQARALWYPSDHSHLNGESVQVLGDGAYLGTETVASGAVALDDDTITNHVGLQITSELQPMKLEGEVHIKNIAKLLLQLFNSLGGKYGENTSKFYQIICRDRDDIFGASAALFSGFKELDFPGTYDRSGNIWIRQDIPLPMTILGMVAKLLAEDGSG